MILNYVWKFRMLMMKEGFGRWEELYEDYVYLGVYEDVLVELDVVLKVWGIECRIMLLEDESV